LAAAAAAVAMVATAKMAVLEEEAILMVAEVQLQRALAPDKVVEL
jgi:hypothetical protein